MPPQKCPAPQHHGRYKEKSPKTNPLFFLQLWRYKISVKKPVLASIPSIPGKAAKTLYMYNVQCTCTRYWMFTVLYSLYYCLQQSYFVPCKHIPILYSTRKLLTHESSSPHQISFLVNKEIFPNELPHYGRTFLVNKEIFLSMFFLPLVVLFCT